MIAEGRRQLVERIGDLERISRWTLAQRHTATSDDLRHEAEVARLINGAREQGSVVREPGR